jgi:uncharacterized damage-inducible protein DinB
MTVADMLLPEHDREIGLTRKLLERLPDGQFGWQPHPKSMMLGRLAEHLAEMPMWVVVTMTRPEFELNTPRAEGYQPPTTCGAVVALFDRNAAEARAAIAGRSDAEMMTGWTLLQDGRALFTMPKAVVLRNFVFNHMVHHRGQLSVYLRMHDVPLPSIYGPSADEAL